ncbi:hypothetical protein Y1Q_0000054 [Alligator mississippiensis]|uniref:Uncharacterized protein n=1 Tax=Alligator mississippiensis TaxID=8496 RepID=A0A151NTZ2_ALLMI|nr:hypothetical protein Y1Q_0000054 [Alligator mississippiensis]
MLCYPSTARLQEPPSSAFLPEIHQNSAWGRQLVGVLVIMLSSLEISLSLPLKEEIKATTNTVEENKRKISINQPRFKH